MKCEIVAKDGKGPCGKPAAWKMQFTAFILTACRECMERITFANTEPGQVINLYRLGE